MRRVVPLLIALTAVLACDKTTGPVPVPTPIATPTISENYTGTLSPSGSNLHFFQVQQDSQVLVTLTRLVTVPVAADPKANPPVLAIPATPITGAVTINVGQQALTTLGVTCSSLKSVVASAAATPQLTGQALKGTYCVSIIDTNAVLPRSTTYAITVAHS
jgi:hypothetical protein